MKEKDQIAAKSKEHLYKDEYVGDKIPIDGDHINGSNVYMYYCASCHSLEANNMGRNSTGPGLGLIYGRRVGSDKYYDYSNALIESNVIWTQKSLFHFLKNPNRFIKGNKC